MKRYESRVNNRSRKMGEHGREHRIYSYRSAADERRMRARERAEWLSSLRRGRPGRRAKR